ncbi:MAG: hypothetical protein HY547_00965 [Elusimicrobia bacterium]|nr:hypothetical protein [Elusimicrobiota bacterium]
MKKLFIAIAIATVAGWRAMAVAQETTSRMLDEQNQIYHSGANLPASYGDTTSRVLIPGASGDQRKWWQPPLAASKAISSVAPSLQGAMSQTDAGTGAVLGFGIGGWVGAIAGSLTGLIVPLAVWGLTVKGIIYAALGFLIVGPLAGLLIGMALGAAIGAVIGAITG